MDLEPNRRRFLATAGTGLTLSLAGCSAPTPDDGQPATEASDGERMTVTLALEIDQQALQDVQQNLTQELENGTVNRTEAQEQLQAAEVEMLGAAAADFQDRIADRDTISVTDTAEQIGVLLVSGTPAALIETLSYEEVRGLVGAETFQQAIARAEGDA